jgi:hypothetical protein
MVMIRFLFARKPATRAHAADEKDSIKIHARHASGWDEFRKTGYPDLG